EHRSSGRSKLPPRRTQARVNVRGRTARPRILRPSPVMAALWSAILGRLTACRSEQSARFASRRRAPMRIMISLFEKYCGSSAMRPHRFTGHHSPPPAARLRSGVHGMAALCTSTTVFAAVQRRMLQAAAALLLTGLSLPAQAQFRDVVVFGDASLRTALDEANKLFLFENGSGIAVSYGTSSALAKQIETGASADVFISADVDWMDHVAERNLIKPDTREKFLGNKLVLIASAGSNVTLSIGQGFPLAQALGSGRLAMADPVGKYGRAALEKLGVWPSLADKVVMTQDAR